MSEPSRFRRMAVLMLTGGSLLQVAGCTSGLAPVFLSLLESAVYSALTAALLTP